ncbi:hypothetical protein GCM10025734_57830 [Kitasatospora paranensis]
MLFAGLAQRAPKGVPGASAGAFAPYPDGEREPVGEATKVAESPPAAWSGRVAGGDGGPAEQLLRTARHRSRAHRRDL